MSGAQEPDLAVVVVNFRTASLTAKAVGSVLDQPEVHEVVVVDNGSGDGSPHLIRSHLAGTRARLVESGTNLGFGRGVNLGASHCTAPLLFFLNSDATVSDGSLGLLRASLLCDDTIGVVAPALYRADGQELQPGAHGVFPDLRSIVLRTNHRPPETVWPDWVSGAAMLLRRVEFETLGGFDPDLAMYLEDVDLCRRIRATGQRVHRLLSASVFHVLGQSWHDGSEQVGWALRSRMVYARKAGLAWPDRLAMRTLSSAHSVRRQWRGMVGSPGRGRP